MILGARAVLNAARTKSDGIIEARRGYWKAVVAIAAKNARLAWASLTRGAAFRMPA